ncbi:DUF7847 domain-containing protein [Halorussus marinus]|uniref:DUF7847 domain-containing protein n=1 Tax=Halorussus marinus TaxID=2505976 RepID=UPI00106EE019|nr:hypothetical protein [Halorussus marinus]
MGAISSLSTTGRTLARNSSLFGAAFVVTLVSFLPTGLSVLLPPPTAGVVMVPLSGLSLLVVPFLTGGLLSMAREGLDGTASFETFLAGGRKHYLRLLAAIVLFVVLFGAIGAVLGMAAIAAFAVGVGAGSAAITEASLVALAILGVLGVLAVGLPVFFLQFYAAAVVVSDLGVAASFKRSAGLVRRNLVSALGYSAVSLAIGAVGGLLGVFFTLFGGAGVESPAPGAGAGAGPGVGTGVPEVAPGVLVAVGAAMVVLTALLSAFGVTYQVAFYDDCLDSLA